MLKLWIRCIVQFSLFPAQVEVDMMLNTFGFMLLGVVLFVLTMA